MDTILIADADLKSRNKLKGLLAENFNIVCVNNGKQAIDVMNNTLIACLIMDFKLDYLDGFEVMNFMKNRNITDYVPVIMICSDNDRDFIKMGYDAGISDKIHRPFDNPFIKKRIINLIKLYSQKRMLLFNKERMEKELLTANEALDARSKFLTEMSHDIRTPMLTINGMAELARSDIDDKFKVKNCMDRLTASAKHLLNLINDVLDISRIENNKMQIHSEKCSIAGIVRDVNLIIWPQLTEMGISFDVETSGITNENIIADSTRIRQLLINILGSSIFHSKNCKDIYMGIEEKKTFRPEYVKYRFTIEKEGFDDEYETSFMYDKNIEFKSENMSFAITKRLVELMNGSINFEREEHGRLIIAVELLLKKDEAYGESAVRENISKVLVVDNNVKSGKSISSYLEDMGIMTDYCDNENEALASIRNKRNENCGYDIIFLKPAITGKSAEETAAEFRKAAGSDVKIAGISYYDTSEENIYDGKLVKPVFKSGLINCINSLYENDGKETDSTIRTDFEGKNILVVDDNAVNRMIAGDILEDVGISMIEAESGRQAIDIVKNSRAGDIDIILMDIQMPLMDGYEATKHIRNLKLKGISDIPVVAMSAETYDSARFIEAEMNYYLPKPAEPDRIYAAMEQIFNRDN